MKKTLRKYLLGAIMIVPTFAFSQTGTVEAVFDTTDIKGQFEYLHTKSNTYEDYKVIKINSLNLLKKNALDSIRMYKTSVSAHQEKITELSHTLTERDTEIQKLTEVLDATQKAQDSINLIGASVSKSTYNSIMWGLIVCLLVISGILVSLFKRNHMLTKAAQNRLAEVEEDFEKHRKNALTREQKLARELMDVKLKYKSDR
ncbi:hypothetical protein [Gaoshiqia sp. Z1-71]|uniref:hypothetical protein n=1 Tax=Gaoshiqia hydrogeniformans TaxID=3290090 RepID=UPI003BF8FB16